MPDAQVIEFPPIRECDHHYEVLVRADDSPAALRCDFCGEQWTVTDGG